MAAATAIVWKVVLKGRPAAPARHSSSCTPTTDTSAESLVMAMKSLATAGVTIRTACGSTTRRRTWRSGRPSERAASTWPCGTAWIPARKTSVR